MTSLESALMILNFTAAEFAAAPSLDVTDRQDALLMSEFEGIAISAPAEVKAGAVLPIAVAVRFDHARAWDVPLGWNLTLVATNIDTGEVFVSEPFDTQVGHKRHSESAPLDRGTRPPDAELEGVAADISWTDSTIARFPVEAGKWRIAVIYHDWVSNIAEVSVSGEPRILAPREPWPLPNDGATTPSYLPLQDAAALSDHATVFSVRIDDADDAQKVYVSGQTRFALRTWMYAQGVLQENNGPKEIVAAVPVSTIWMQRDAGIGTQLPFVLPIYAPQSEQEATATGAFNLDLLAGGGKDYRLPAGEYAVWFLIDGLLYGPELNGIQ